jgi:zinc transporter, ZIP family
MAEPATTQPQPRVPSWASWAGIAVLVATVLAVLGLLGGRALPDRVGPPIEELAVEHSVLTPGWMELTVRNTGPDPVTIAQVFVNDAYVDVRGGTEPIGRLGSATLKLNYPWQDGQPYVVSMLTATGLVIEHEIHAAVETPHAGLSFYGLMALLGIYVGIVPVLLGMLFLPVLRRSRAGAVRFLLALTVGLLAFLAVDATAEGLELAQRSGGAFGGPMLVVFGAALAYLVLTGVDRYLRTRGDGDSASATRLAFMISGAIGLHNLGEGLAIGSAYAVGELALGAFLIVGFALHNTTEGVAIVAPLARQRTSLRTLLLLGALAGAPAIIGAVVGAGVNNAELSALLLGVGVGAIVAVVVQIVPALRRDGQDRADATAVTGVIAGILLMYVTALLVTA